MMARRQRRAGYFVRRDLHSAAMVERASSPLFA
jgi:hypothetical protein